MCRSDFRDQLARAFCGYWNGSRPSESPHEQWDLIATSYSLANRAMPIIKADRDGYQKGVLDAFAGVLDVANARADKAETEVARLRKALDAIANGDIPRTVAKQWRADGKPSKHDQCTHGAFMYEDCGNCTAAFARAALQEKPDEYCA